MQHDFWQERWARGQIGFHQGRPNAQLIAHLPALGLASGARLFLPLCGKTRDIAWLAGQGFRVAGAELVEQAVRDLFAEMSLSPSVTPLGPLTRYSAPGIDIFAGDIFALDPATLGPVDAVYDRAALVALPPEMRARYAAHLVALTATAPQLLLTFEYDQRLMAGPPFSVKPPELRRLYGASHRLTLLERLDLDEGLRGRPASDAVWHLQPRAATEPQPPGVSGTGDRRRT